MLNRMDYLATQSANGTYQDEVDREALQKEVNQLRDEINRIADSANFNGIKLLDGSLATEGGSAATSVGKIEGIGTIDIDATKAAYGTKAAVPTAPIANVGDKLTATVSLTDADGKATKEITVELTCTDITGNGKYEDADGNEYTPAGKTAEDAAKMLAEALNKNADIKANFKVSVADDTEPAVAAENGLRFDAKAAGSSTMKVSAINISTTAKGADPVIVVNGVQSKAGVDSYQTLDITKAKIYVGEKGTPTAGKNGTTDLEKAIFSINGKKFAFIT